MFGNTCSIRASLDLVIPAILAKGIEQVEEVTPAARIGDTILIATPIVAVDDEVNFTPLSISGTVETDGIVTYTVQNLSVTDDYSGSTVTIQTINVRATGSE